MPPHMLAAVHAMLEGMAANPEIVRVRRAAHDALRPVSGQRLLDAGCGVGEVARQLAADVAPGGEVVALDFSTTTVAAAAQRHDGNAVQYVTGDVTALEFPDEVFDGVRCERVLQHLADPDGAVRELVRVTRPEGRICLIDTDWESPVIDGVPEDMVAAVRTHIYSRAMLHNRSMGRTLRRRLVRAGVLDVVAVPVTCCFVDPAAASMVLPMLNTQVPPEAGMLPDGMRDAWFSAVASAAARNEFLAALTIWVAAGTRPVR